MKNKATQTYRQGDVMLIPVEEIPQGLAQTKEVILAYGEVSNHSHVIQRGAKGYGQTAEGLCSYLEIAEALADLQHEEHGTIKIAPGRYEVRIQREYSPLAIRNVAD